MSELPTRFVVLLTAAAHRLGKPLVAQLAAAGADLAITSLALLASRVAIAERNGARAIALRMNANDPLSVRLALGTVTAELGPPDLLVHVAPHELVVTARGVDACTDAVATAMQGRRGSIVYLLQPEDRFPEAAAREWAERGVALVGVAVSDRDTPDAIAAAVLSAFHAQRGSSCP